MESNPGATLDIHDFAIPVWPNLRFLLRGNIDVLLEEKHSFHAPPAMSALFGGTTAATHVHITGPFKIIGASFFPRGWREIFATPASTWANKAGRVAEIWGDEPVAAMTALHDAATDIDIRSIMDQLLIRRILAAKAPAVPDTTHDVERLLVDPHITSVDMIAAHTGLSLRQIERIALTGYGHPPKQVIRKFRFLRTMATLGRTPNGAWKDMIDQLYYDQSHFIRDFRQFTGITPTEYQKNPPMIMKGFIQSLGTTLSLQTLPATFSVEALAPDVLAAAATSPASR
jgi:AraC-like DNA-binding protein